MSDFPTHSPAQLLTLRQVAATIGKSHETVRTWWADGWLVPTAETTNTKLFSPAAVRAALERVQDARLREVIEMQERLDAYEREHQPTAGAA